MLANVLSVGCDSWGRPWQLPLPGASLPPGAKGRASDPTSKEGGRPRGGKGKGKGKDRTARDDRNIIGKSSNEPADSDEEEDEDEEEDMRIGEEEEGESTTTDTLAALLLSSRLDSPARLHYKTSHQG